MSGDLSALQLVFTGDPGLFAIVRLSLLISLSAVLATQGMAGIYLIFGVVIIMQYRVILARRPARAGAQTPVSV